MQRALQGQKLTFPKLGQKTRVFALFRKFVFDFFGKVTEK